MDAPSVLYWIGTLSIAAFVTGLTIVAIRNRKGAGNYLCDDCKFNDPNMCLKSERPRALICTAYRTKQA